MIDSIGTISYLIAGFVYSDNLQVSRHLCVYVLLESFVLYPGISGQPNVVRIPLLFCHNFYNES